MLRFSKAAWIVLLPVVLGCTPAKLDIVPVQGQITYGGGDWPNGGNLYFQPKTAAANLPMRPGVATFNADGKFVAKTGQRNGLVPGTYALRIECWEDAPKMSAPGSGKSWVAPEYTQGPTANFEIEVPADAKGRDLKIDIPKRP